VSAAGVTQSQCDLAHLGLDGRSMLPVFPHDTPDGRFRPLTVASMGVRDRRSASTAPLAYLYGPMTSDADDMLVTLPVDAGRYDRASQQWRFTDEMPGISGLTHSLSDLRSLTAPAVPAMKGHL
jgi:hypothetical protein